MAVGACGWCAVGADEVIPLPQPSVKPGAFGNGNELAGTECDAGVFAASGRVAKIGEFAAGAACCTGWAAGITGATGAAGRGAGAFCFGAALICEPGAGASIFVAT